VLCARTQIKYGKNLGARVDGQPEYLSGAAQPGAQFVQLEVREPEMAEEAFVQGLCMFPCTSQPRRDGGLSIAEDAFSRGRVQPFGQRRQHDCDLPGRVFKRYRGVCRRALNVVRQAGPRKGWMCSAWPCLPSPTSACMEASVLPK